MRILYSLIAFLVLLIPPNVEAQDFIDERVIPASITRDAEIAPTGSDHICISNTPGPTPVFELCNPLDLTGLTVLFKIPEYTVATLPASHPFAIVTDAASSSTCTSGGGSSRHPCWWNGTTWVPVGSGGGGGIAAADIQSNTFLYCLTGGSANAYTCAPAGGAVAAYTDGMVLWVRFHEANTGATNITVSGLGNRAILNADGTALASGTLLADGRTYPIIYRSTGTAFRMLQDLTGSGGAGISGLTTNCLPKATSSTAINACSGIANPASNEWHYGTTSGNRYERTQEAPTGVHTQVWRAKAGDIAMSSGPYTAGDAVKFNVDGVLVRAGPARKILQPELAYPTNDVVSGNGQYYFRVPSTFAGMNLVAVSANVITAGTTGVTSVQITRCAATASGNACTGATAAMLSTVLSIDSGENSSTTAATPAVIDTANDDITEGQLLRFDITAVSTTAPKGLVVNAEFVLP